MTPLVFVAVSLAGGVGAALRLVVDGSAKSRFGDRFPYGTLLINLSGSLVLGFVTGLTAAAVLPDAWRLIAGTGLLGGYTTFGTSSFETIRLLQHRRRLDAAINGFGTLIAGVALAAAGYILGLGL